jgi:hypothetical protein
MTESRPQDLTDGALGRRARLDRAEPLTPSGREERLDLDALEKVALAATEGPWVTDFRFGKKVLVETPGHYPLAITDILPRAAGVEVEQEANAAHIATFDPLTVLRLIAAARHPISSEDDNAGGADTARAGDETEREEIARIIGGLTCTATGGDHEAIQDGRYRFCGKCGETLRARPLSWSETRAKADDIIDYLARRSMPADTGSAGGLERLLREVQTVLLCYGDFSPEGDDSCLARATARRIDAALSAAPTPTQEGKEEERSQSQPCAEAGTHIPPSPEAQHADGVDGLSTALRTALEIVAESDNEAAEARPNMGGLADCVNNHGGAFQSATLAAALGIIKRATGRVRQGGPSRSQGLSGRQGSGANTSEDGLVRDEPSSPTQEGADDNAGAGDSAAIGRCYVCGEPAFDYVSDVNSDLPACPTHLVPDAGGRG